MTKTRKCCKCQKEIAAGKFYSFFTGKKGGQRIVEYQSVGDNFFHPDCAKKEKNDPDNLFLGNLLEIEWEVGNSTDEQILEFEEKWWKYYVHNEFIKKDSHTDPELILAWCQKARQELAPYLQKLDLVVKSFGGKLPAGYGKKQNFFYYLFAQSAKNEKYRQEVVAPTIAEILGSQFHQEINTTNTGSAPGVPGRTEGKLEVEVGNKKYIVPYVWTDGPEGICRRICFEIADIKWALQSFLRALTIKEKELTGKSPADNQQDNNKPDQNNNDNSPPPSGNAPPLEPSNKNEKNNPNKSSYALWISLSVGGVLLIGSIIWFFTKKKKKKQ